MQGPNGVDSHIISLSQVQRIISHRSNMSELHYTYHKLNLEIDNKKKKNLLTCSTYVLLVCVILSKCEPVDEKIVLVNWVSVKNVKL